MAGLSRSFHARFLRAGICRPGPLAASAGRNRRPRPAEIARSRRVNKALGQAAAVEGGVVS
jgi:hypothetical protein